MKKPIWKWWMELVTWREEAWGWIEYQANGSQVGWRFTDPQCPAFIRKAHGVKLLSLAEVVK